MAEKWITYYRENHPSGNLTRLEDEHVAIKSRFKQRPATDEEIAAEKARRAEIERESAERKSFESRPDYIAAVAIRNALEWISPVDHMLDRLTIEEWEELRKKICE